MPETVIWSAVPIPVFADAGAIVPLTPLLQRAFAPQIADLQYYWVDSTTADQFGYQFSYWTPSSPSLSQWTNGANPVGRGAYEAVENYSALQSISLQVGSDIASKVYVSASIDPVGPDFVTNVYQVQIVPSRFAVDYRVNPTPADIVHTALDLADAYKGIANPAECGNVANAIAGGTGAPMNADAQNEDPRLNTDGGLWRVVHRGSDNPIKNWESLVQPGDIVRLVWDDHSSPHTFTAVSGERPDGSIMVVDNDLFVGKTTYIGLHAVNYDQQTDPATVTIYRLSPDGFNLLSGTGQSESLIGTFRKDQIVANGGDDRIYAGDGDDLILLGSGFATVDGGSGRDTVKIPQSIGVERASVSGSTVTLAGAQTGTFSAVERLQFADGVLAFDSNGDAGQGYRLYQAAFNRTPDKSGLSFWVHSLDAGQTLQSVASGFVGSAEFKAIYGAAPTSEEIVARLYTNVLGRAGEKAGTEYWVGLLHNGTSVADVLTSFSESPENVAKVAPVISAGISLDTTVFI